MVTNVHTRQSLLDIAVQHCGSVEQAFQMALLNGLSLTEDVQAGANLELAPAADASVVSYYTVNELQPATAVTDEAMNDLLDDGDGIEFWAIEFDFVVS